MNTTTKLFLTRKEAADAFGISLRTLDYLISRRQVLAIKMGRRVLVPIEGIERLASELRAKAHQK